MIETTSLARLKDPELLRADAYIDGQWVTGSPGSRFRVDNPSDNSVVAEVANLDRGDAERAIEAAASSLRSWRLLTGKERGDILRRWYELILEHAEDLAKIITLEQGKPVGEALNEIRYGASFMEWYAEEAKRIEGDILGSSSRSSRILVLKQGIGVCGAITPWNYPNAMVTRKVAPALAAGCSIVLKPAEQTPLSALALAVLGERAGVPAGVFNVIVGDEKNSIEMGKALCESETVRKITFTGSTEVGRILMAQSAPTIKKLSLELGGHAPFIVFDDADLDIALESAIVSKFRGGGQTCIASNRFYVQRRIHDDFVQGFQEKVAGLVIDDGMNPKADVGPLIDGRALKKVSAHVADALEKGARTVIGGKVHSSGGLFYEPTILSGVSKDAHCMSEETFGPVAPVCAFDDDAQVLSLANDTKYGLAAYMFSRDVNRVITVSEELEYGMVGVNTGFISNAAAPFGGIKQSGLGREGSKYGLDEFLETKYVCLGGIR